MPYTPARDKHINSSVDVTDSSEITPVFIARNKKIIPEIVAVDALITIAGSCFATIFTIMSVWIEY